MIQLTFQAEDAGDLLKQLAAIGAAAGGGDKGPVNPLDHYTIAEMEAELNRRMKTNGMVVAFVPDAPDNPEPAPEDEKPKRGRGRPKKQKEPEPEPDTPETGAEPEPEEDDPLAGLRGLNAHTVIVDDPLAGLLDETGAESDDDIKARFEAVGQKLRDMMTGSDVAAKTKAKMAAIWFKSRFDVALLAEITDPDHQRELVQYCEQKGITA